MPLQSTAMLVLLMMHSSMAMRMYTAEPGIVGFLHDIPLGITRTFVDSRGSLWYQPSLESGYRLPSSNDAYPNSENVYVSVSDDDDYATCSTTQTLVIRKANSGTSITVDAATCSAVAFGDNFVFRLTNTVVRAHWHTSGVVELATISVPGQTIRDIAAVGTRLYLLTESGRLYTYKGGITTLWRAADTSITGIVRSFNTLCIMYGPRAECYNIYGEIGVETPRSAATGVKISAALILMLLLGWLLF